MKNISKILLVLVIFISGVTLLQAQSTSCNTNSDNPNCTWSAWGYNFTKVITFQYLSYPACQCTVTYNHRVCLDQNGFPLSEQYQLVNWEYNNCTDLSVFMDNLMQTDINKYWEESRKIMTEMNMQLQVEIFQDQYNGSGDKTPFHCIAPPPSCLNSWNIPVQVITEMSKCGEIIQIGNSPTNPTFKKFGYMDCNGEECCIIKRTFCMDNSSIPPAVRKCETRYSAGFMQQCQGNSLYTPPVGWYILCRSGCKAVACELN